MISVTVPELVDILTWCCLEQCAFVRVENDEVELALNLADELHNLVGVFNLIIHALEHDILKEHVTTMAAISFLLWE